MGLVIIAGKRLERRLRQEQGGGRRRGLLLRLCLPSNAELLFALVWASCLTLAVFESIVRPGG